MDGLEQPVTAEELLLITEREMRCDLIRGEVVWSPFLGGRESESASHILYDLGRFNYDRSLGTYLMATGFILERDPDTVLGPDLSFLRAARRPPPDEWDGYVPGPPDLAIEIVCQDDTARYLLDKTDLYLSAGTPILWLVDPKRRMVLDHRAGGFRILHVGDTLDGGDVLPGFRLPVADIFR